MPTSASDRTSHVTPPSREIATPQSVVAYTIWPERSISRGKQGADVVVFVGATTPVKDQLLPQSLLSTKSRRVWLDDIRKPNRRVVPFWNLNGNGHGSVFVV